MYIRQLFAQKPCVFSLEVFPPKQQASYESLQNALRQMAELKPDFISVTYERAARRRAGYPPARLPRF